MKIKSKLININKFFKDKKMACIPSFSNKIMAAKLL